MLYKIRPCNLNADGTVTEGKRAQLYITRQKLQIGGLYFLRSQRLYRVIEEVEGGAQ